MKNKISKIVLTLSLMLCVVISICVFDVKAEQMDAATIDDCNKVFKAYTAERATTYLEGDNTVPTKEGYLFAGWYTTDKLPENAEEAVQFVVENSVPEGVSIVYALFVPEDVLTVKAQVSKHLSDSTVDVKDEAGVIRFVTSVDTVLYKSVGFDISYQRKDGSTKEVTKTSNKVYKKLYEADSTDEWEVYPYQEFCGVSEYFKICTITGVPQDNYATEFTVKPFWITLSGDKVYGEEAVKVFEDGCFRNEVYVSSSVDGAANLPYCGTESRPYASLDYALARVEDGGTVHVKGELKVASDATWNKHGKTVTITGDGEGTLDFSTQSSRLNIRDNVTFTALDLRFKQYVFCNGYHVKVASDVNVLNSATGDDKLYIYGGAQTASVAKTYLVLHAGSYNIIYGGGHDTNAHVTGDTYVELGAGVNPDAQYTDHEKRNYLVFGGCRKGTVNGDTKVVVREGAKVEHLYGGGNQSSTIVEGSTHVEFEGNAYSVYGGSFEGTNGNTSVKMTGGIAYQVFGGCEKNSMTGNTDVQILGGDVFRRIYGGCYNNWEVTWKTSQKVMGQTSVTVGTNVSLNSDTDQLLCAFSRYEGVVSGETGVVVLRNGLHDGLSSKIKNFIGNDAYHYLVSATVGGTVSQEGDSIYIKPQDGNHATVRLDNATTGEIVYYAEEAGYYPLPELVNEERKVYVSFDTSVADEFMTNAAAKIGTVYYKTLDEAITAAEKAENAAVTDLGATKTLASITIKDSDNGTVSSNYKNCVAGTEVTLNVEAKTGYYCKALTVKKDGVEIELPELTLTNKAYAFTATAGDYVVEARFAKKVFKNPSATAASTEWNVLQQNETTEILVNGGSKVSGKVTAKDLKGDGSTNTLNFIEKYTDMAVAFTVRETQESPANYSRGTQVVFDFDGYVLQLRLTQSGGKNYIRVVGGRDGNTNVHTFTETQAAAYNSKEGVEVRFVRYGTILYMYVDGEQTKTPIDLNSYSTAYSASEKEVTASTEMTVGVKFLSDKDVTVDMPFSITDTLTPAVVNVQNADNGTIATNSKDYFAGDTVKLTVSPKDDYYCNVLSVTKSGEIIALNETLKVEESDYTFKVEEGICNVNGTFVKKVFENPSPSNTKTVWDVIKQNENTKVLANNGTKISGTICAKDIIDADSSDTLRTINTYSDVDVTFIAKGSSTKEATTAIFDFNGYTFGLRAVKRSEGVVLRVVSGSKKDGKNYLYNPYTFTEAQAAKYESSEGVEVRLVRSGTDLYMYVDGTKCPEPIDLKGLSEGYGGSKIVGEDTPVTLGFQWFGVTNANVEIPFSIADTIVPSVSILSTDNGVVQKDAGIYSVGDTVTLTVNPEDGYYCNMLNVKKNGKAISLNENFAMEGETYTFEVEEDIYTVEASFVQKVFTSPSASNTKTIWNVIKQNESTEILANGGTKVSGTLYAKDIIDADSSDTLRSIKKYTDIDVTFMVKGSSTKEGTTAVFDFNGYTFSLRAVKRSEGVVLRVVSGSKKDGQNYLYNPYTFTEAQAEKYESSEGVEVRLVRSGTDLYMYVDGTKCPEHIDLKGLSEGYGGNKIVGEDTPVTLGFQWFGVTDAQVEIPFSITDKVTPATIEVYNDASVLVANVNAATNEQNIDLTSNETYSVKVTPQGFDATAYLKITYVDHVTKETKSVYTSAVPAGESFEFTYQNGVFNTETDKEIATIRWENRIKATKDVLTVEVISGEAEGETIVSGATLGNAPMKKPTSTTVQTNWTGGYNIGSYNHAVGPNSITAGQHYAYTDVITVPKKGTKLTFTDTKKNNSWASNGCYVVSSWKQNAEGEWELDLEGTNIPGQYKGSNAITSDYDTFIERYGTDTTDGSITYTYITSKDNEHIRFCYYAGKNDDNATKNYPTITMTYSGEVGTAEEIALAVDTSEWLESDKTRAYYDMFEGKTISVIGDSYMAGSSIANTSDVWVNMLATKYGMTMKNHGQNSSPISNYKQPGEKDAWVPMVDRWETDFASDNPDIIIVEGGRNDYNYNVPMGKLGTMDQGTFKGATTYLISSLKEKYPNAIIIGITCWEVGGDKNAAGYYCSDYGRAFIEVCEELGVSYINSMDSDAIGIYMTSSNFRGRFCLKAGDVSHLNEKGMKLVFQAFEQKIYEICNK